MDWLAWARCSEGPHQNGLEPLGFDLVNRPNLSFIFIIFFLFSFSFFSPSFPVLPVRVFSFRFFFSSFLLFFPFSVSSSVLLLSHLSVLSSSSAFFFSYLFCFFFTADGATESSREQRSWTR
jgi:hypothetical protein